MEEVKRDTIVIDDGSVDRMELQDQITQVPIEALLFLDEFLNLEDEAVVDEDEGVFVSIINHYSITKLGEEEESRDEEEVKKVDMAEALRVVETVKMWKLQKGDSQDLDALNRLARDITQYKISVGHQTTIYRFFKLK